MRYLLLPGITTFSGQTLLETLTKSLERYTGES